MKRIIKFGVGYDIKKKLEKLMKRSEFLKGLLGVAVIANVPIKIKIGDQSLDKTYNQNQLDEVIDIEEYMYRLIAEAWAKREDEIFFSGIIKEEN